MRHRPNVWIACAPLGAVFGVSLACAGIFGPTDEAIEAKLKRSIVAQIRQCPVELERFQRMSTRSGEMFGKSVKKIDVNATYEFTEPCSGWKCSPIAAPPGGGLTYLPPEKRMDRSLCAVAKRYDAGDRIAIKQTVTCVREGLDWR